MRIISWNVNGLRARQDSVRKLASDYKPDILCLQKIRTAGLMTIPGYFGWLGMLNIDEGLFGGVSTFINLETTGFDFNSQRNDMPEWLSQTGSLNVLRFPQFILVNAYFPYSNTSDDNFIKIRQRWDYELHEYLVRLSRHHNIIMCGDMNIVAEDKDAWDGVSSKNQGCFFDWEHRNFNSLIKEANLIDTYRQLNPEGRDYSYFFNNKPEYRLMNQGFRIDYFLTSKSLLPNIIRSEILADIIDTTNSPILLDLTLP